MKQWWRRWTYEVPLAVGDALWEVLVVRLAALLDRLTVRKLIASIPVAIIVLAYYHRIPIPPELMLVGDFLAYVDIFSVLFLVGMLSRVTTVMFFVKQAAVRVAQLTGGVVAHMQRLDIRHRRERGAWSRPHRKSDRPEHDLTAFERDRAQIQQRAVLREPPVCTFWQISQTQERDISRSNHPRREGRDVSGCPVVRYA
ncbi:hypothetical protein [Bradyrhizobium sp. 179]|uniref:hypothetical protein n=1 Tax=Bradyrhizobium sp. 179 TaxID=2782648 RepID=UPI001FF87008|nr:hypothetical protein [Bradyrhizobium sp. 179]